MAPRKPLVVNDDETAVGEVNVTSFTDRHQRLPAAGTSEHDYFAIARRQADALNELEARQNQTDEILRTLVTEVQQAQFRIEALEAKPVPVDYGDKPPGETRPLRRPTPLCDECGCALPSHYDHCSGYVPPRERAA